MMKRITSMSRRDGLKGALALGLAAGFAAADKGSANADEPARNGKVLVACFTRSGNTLVIARQISRSLKADFFEIRPLEPYPEDYEETVALAERERLAGFEPPLAATVPSVDTYEKVFLAFPIWGTTAPAVIRSFLSRHDMTGKTLIPVITHGGYGVGSSLRVLAEHAPRARLADGFVMEADQERRTMEQVRNWLGSAKING